MPAGNTLEGLSPGRYEIQFFPSDDHIQQYYNGRATLSSADPVTVVSGAATTNVDAALVQGGGSPARSPTR